MSDPVPRFQHAYLKLKWADKHISQLEAAWNAFLKTEFCKVVLENNPDGSQELRVESLQPLWLDFPLLVGDAVHSMRSSLDYALSEILGWQNTRIGFPMSESSEELEASFRTQPEVVGGRTKGKGRNAAIEEAVSGITSFFIDDVRPYKGADNPLWVLNRLDQRDKHRLILPVLSIQSITGICGVDNNHNTFTNLSGGVDAGGVCRMFHFGNGGLKITDYGTPTANILLNESGVIERASLFPALAQMRQSCHETIRKLDGFLTSIGWTSTNS